MMPLEGARSQSRRTAAAAASAATVHATTVFSLDTRRDTARFPSVAAIVAYNGCK
jgi:hypothetical protein